MGVEYRIVRATEEHARNLAPRMRPEDAEEIRVAQDLDPLEGVLYALHRSVIARTALARSNGSAILVAAMWGVIPLETYLAGNGQPWLLTSEIVERHPRTFMRETRRQLAEFSALFPTLLNVMDVRYSRAARWAARIGFDVSPPFLFGPPGKMWPHRGIELTR